MTRSDHPQPDHHHAIDGRSEEQSVPSARSLAELRQLVDSLSRNDVSDAALELRGELGEAELADGSAARAVVQFDLVVAALSEQFGACHEDTMVARGFLGRALTDAHLLARAEQVLHDLLADRLEVLGADHPRTLATRGNLLRAIGRSGRPEEALRMAEQLLADRLRLIGPDHAETLQTRGHIAQLLDLAGRNVEGLAAHEALWADRVRVLGVDHPDTQVSEHNLTLAAAAWDDTALDGLVDYLADSTDRLGFDHPATMTLRFRLATCLMHDGRYDEAELALRQLIADRTRVLGELDPATVNAQVELASLAVVQGDLIDAQRLLDAVVRMSAATLGATNIQTLYARYCLAWALRYSDPHDRFEQVVDALTADARDVLEPWHPLATWIDHLWDTGDGAEVEDD